jgi:sugar phosphate isomerase/epimerase
VHRAVQRDGRSRIALDTEFLAKHQQIETVFTTDWLWQKPLVRHAHIKDYDGEGFSADGRRRYLHPGEGGIDFARFFAGLKQHNFPGTISLEAPAIDQGGHVDLARLRASLASLRQMIDA